MSSKTGLTEKDNFLKEYQYLFEMAKSYDREINRLVTENGDVVTGPLWTPLLKQLEQKINDVMVRRNKITGCIEAIKNPKLRTVLQLAYIECITQEEIMERMHYSSTQWVRELINQGLALVKIDR
ncbi:MAG: DUF1492 domain-containing protein [Acetobacterium woodii]|nr:DUF1492 domain-containing protein [Acetobacterium woodii]